MNRRRDGSIRLFLAVCCWACAALKFLTISAFAWVLRDGLGPDSVESHGWVALIHCLRQADRSLLGPFALLLAGLLLYWSDPGRAARVPAAEDHDGRAFPDPAGLEPGPASPMPATPDGRP